MFKHKVFIVFIALLIAPLFSFAQNTIYAIWYDVDYHTSSGCQEENHSNTINIYDVTPTAYSRSWSMYGSGSMGDVVYSRTKPWLMTTGWLSAYYTDNGDGTGSASNSVTWQGCGSMDTELSSTYSPFQVKIDVYNLKPIYCQSEKFSLTLPGVPSRVDWYISVNGGSRSLYKSAGTNERTDYLEITYADLAAYMRGWAISPVGANFNFTATVYYNTDYSIVETTAATPTFRFDRELPKPASITAEPAKCSGQNGVIHFNNIRTYDGAVFTGSPVFYIKLNDGVTVTDVLIDKANVDVSVPPGIYTAAAVESSGTPGSSSCIWTQPGTINVGAATPVVPSSTISCYNGSPAVTLGASGGRGPYQFSIGSVVNPPGNLFTGLTPGISYTGVITDANGCITNTTINMLPAVTATSGNIVAPTSTAPNGSVTIVAAGGSGAPYTYSMDGNNWQTDATFTGLAAGNYRFYTKDKSGCISATPLDLTLLALDFTFTTTDASCSDVDDGVISVTVTGGASPYSYRLNSDAYRLNEPVISFLAGGTYSVWVRDANGVEISKPVTVGAPAPLLITGVTPVNATCRDMANGSITVNASGGNIGGFTYYINNALPQASNVFAVKAGTYTMRVDDSKGCSVSATAVTITEPATKVAVSAVTNDVFCFGTATGTITTSGSNGLPPYSYNVDGGTWQTATTFNVAAGTYTVAIKDAKGCENTRPNVTVNTPARLVAIKDTMIAVSCFGYTDGQIKVSATGGTGSISYYINTAPLVATAGAFTGLPAGDYTITAKDDNSCTATIDITVTQPAQIKGLAVATPVRCFGQANGSMRVNNVTGGNGGYTYAIDNVNFGTTPQFDNLIANNYIIYIKDEKGCHGQETADVTQLAAVDFTMTGSDALCNGGATGEIRIVASGGTNTYTYSVDGGVFGASPVITGLTAGNKTVVVKDANNCQLSKSILIGEPTPLLLSVTNIGKVSCFGGNNGSLTVKASGGTLPYTYKINTGAYQNDALFGQLTAGTYDITVKDGKGCETTIRETVTEFSRIGINIISKTDVLCNGAATGAISLNATGGAGTYSYDFNSAGYQSESSWQGLVANNYSLLVKDVNGCEVPFTLPIVDLYAPLTANLVSNPPASCDDKGSIVVNTTNGGLAPYTYSLDDVNYTSATTFDQLLNGDYTVYIKDANSCIITRELSPYGPVTIRGVVTSSAASCKDSVNGSLTVSGVTGGNNSYEYSLDGVSFQSSPVFTGLRAGAYTVHVRDIPYSCHIVINSRVDEPVLLEAVLADRNQVACFGESNGSLTITARGGTAAYEWSIDGVNYQPTGLFEQLTAGNYTTYVKDANGCIGELPLSVSQPLLLTAQVTVQKDPNCYGESNGKIDLKAEGGTLPYNYQANGNNQTLASFTGLQKGHYALKVIDANGCNVSMATDLAQPELLTLSLVTADDVLCFGRSEGKIEVAADGGTVNYNYTLNNLPAQASPVFEHLPAGEYLLVATDAHGCKVNLSEKIEQPSLLTFSKNVTQPLCSYSTDGGIVMTMNGGTEPYRYDWSTGATAPGITNLNGGTYSVTMTDAHGCELTDQTVIIHPEAMAIDLGFRDTVLCVGQQLHLSAGNPGKQYLWQSDAGFNATTQLVTVGETGNYTLTVTNDAGCFVKAEFSLRTSLEALTTEFLVSSYNAVGDTVVIMDVSRPKPTRLEWTLPAAGRDAGSNADGSIRQLIFDKPGTYDLGLLARLGECAGSMQKSITILPRGEQGSIDSLLGYREKLIKDVVVSPNPASSQFKVDIRLSKAAAVNVKVINFNNGQIMDMKQSAGSDSYQLSFDADRLPQGVYLIGVQVEGEYVVKKLLKL
ncbi:T9SS type A sorting domain-containing protein [Chitinophaga sp. S165]|uniref:T9SS type A sorting domain-containing protein n=1 Tax=Chitinophaga sp. S165 TaxID=2135462 RepID=UPI000D70A017|nr:T9SS type A sorting domain-containing protein [Chitinophaga sp. S165]PWV51888.1 putative secreted protein (Por secretion system target) [Chitinophaga sp. S165]